MGKRTLTNLNAARVCQSAHLALWISLAVAGCTQVPQSVEPAVQAPAEPCHGPTEFAQVIAEANPTARLIADFTDTGAFLVAFNAEPPPSNVAADRILILRRAGASIDMIGFFRDGCLTTWATMRSAVVDRVLGSPA